MMDWINFAWMILSFLTFISALVYFGGGRYGRAVFLMFLGWLLVYLKVTGRLG